MSKGKFKNERLRRSCRLARRVHNPRNELGKTLMTDVTQDIVGDFCIVAPDLPHPQPGRLIFSGERHEVTPASFSPSAARRADSCRST